MTTVSVRYIVNDVGAAIAFYCEHLGFHEDMHPVRLPRSSPGHPGPHRRRASPAFAMLSRGDLRLVLSSPGGGPGGGQAMPDGTLPTPGGWNRFSIEVTNLEAAVERLRAAGVHFRNDIVTGVGGKQILVDDPSGNPVELFEPTLAEARLGRAGEAGD
jgi:catechol 2,3-dioxygenase-like lactoylglutathione lyase family enzyme